MILLKKRSTHGVEEKIREKAIPLNQDSGGESEPNRGDDWCCSKKFRHREKDKDVLERIQRGEMVTLSSLSSNLPLVSSPKAAIGQVADANKDLKARDTSI
jgi:hypothetical protein